MKTPEVRPYWEALYKKRGQLVVKRVFDLAVALNLLVVLAAPMGVIAVLIKKVESGNWGTAKAPPPMTPPKEKAPEPAPEAAAEGEAPAEAPAEETATAEA